MVATWFELQEVTVQVDSLTDKLSSNMRGILAVVGKPIYNIPAHTRPPVFVASLSVSTHVSTALCYTSFLYLCDLDSTIRYLTPCN